MSKPARAAETKTMPQQMETPHVAVDLQERLSQIRSSPKLQSQQQTAVVLTAVEDTLREQKSEFTPTAYFAALLSLLNQSVSAANGISNKDVATAVIYLLDLVTPHVPQPLLRSKFSQILTSLGPALALADADAPFLRSSIGCLVSLLVAQDAQGWALPQSQVGPRRAMAGLLTLAADPRPKVRKRAQEGLETVLKNGPPTPSMDHPAADMCAETALRSFESLATASQQGKNQKSTSDTQGHDPALIHAMQLVKAIASASGGWPSKSLDSLCEVLFLVAKSKSEFLTMAAFDVFEAIFEGMAKEQSFSKLPRLLEAVTELQPAQNDTQLLPPWLAVLSRGYDVSAQVEPEETFQKLPELFTMISSFLASSSHNIRVSASECLISLLVNCVPDNAIIEPSIYDEKILEKVASNTTNLLSVKYQSSWMEVFNVIGAALEVFRWRSAPLLEKAISVIGELRSNESFAGKQQADEVLSKAIRAMGPEAVLDILPLNLGTPAAGKPGRAWLLPLIRDSVANTNLSHFKKELVPLSEKMFQRVLDQKSGQKSVEIKIFETLVQQIWACLPGYCDRPLDVEQSFDQGFAEMLSTLMYQQPEMRLVLCRSLQRLVDTNKAIVDLEGEEDLLIQGRISKEIAQNNLKHLATFAPNLLAVLFNIYSETAPQQRGSILACIDSYLGITGTKELSETFDRVASLLDSSIKEEAAKKSTQAPKPTQPDTNKTLLSHALMDIIVTIAVYLPREGFPALFNIASLIISQQQDSQLQKKAYKLIPRLAQSPSGKAALRERNAELRQMLMNSAEQAMVPARKDRLLALSTIVDLLAREDLYFIPCVLPEVILCTKETNEKARLSAFDLLVQMGEKMQAGGTIDNNKVSHMSDDTPAVEASLDEFFTMLSAGLAGSTPHMISASVTAISRALFEFRSALSEAAVSDLVQTMDLFLKSPSREIVRSVLGFVKVCVISLPVQLMLPRLKTLVPSLMGWSHEHKAHFKVKVKNILERMIRRYGVEIIERHCPEEDKKLITNIRKTRERRKRKKAAAEDEEGAEEGGEGGTSAATEAPRRAKYENEFDQAIYGSDDEDESAASGSDVEDDDVKMRDTKKSRGGKQSGGQTYIVEDEDEPLDLLDRKALAKISSTRPLKARDAVPLGGKRRKAQIDLDGKLVLNDDAAGGADAEMADVEVDEGDGTLEGGINAYVAAIKGRNVAQRGQRGRLKFNTKRVKSGDDEDEEDDGGREEKAARPSGGMGRGRGDFARGRGDSARGRGDFARGRGGFGGGRGGGRGGDRGVGRGFQTQRRGLGVDKTKGGRVEKRGGGGVGRVGRVGKRGFAPKRRG